MKKNELFVGRVAMLGFAAELVGEVCALPEPRSPPACAYQESSQPLHVLLVGVAVTEHGMSG